MLLDGRLTLPSRPDRLLTKITSARSSAGLVSNKLLADGLAVAVNPNLNISGLTIDQVKSIYTGKTTNWKQLGGPDIAIKSLFTPHR